MGRGYLSPCDRELRGMYQYSGINAKIKAMMGKRLTFKDYEELINKRSVGEIASYLKFQTSVCVSADWHTGKQYSPWGAGTPPIRPIVQRIYPTEEVCER